MLFQVRIKKFLTKKGGGELEVSKKANVRAWKLREKL